MEGDDFGVSPCAVVVFATSQDSTCESQRGAGHYRGLGRDKVAVVQGNLAEVDRHVLNSGVVAVLGSPELDIEVDGGVADCPLEGVEDVHLHPLKLVRAVETAAHSLEPADWGGSAPLFDIFGSYEKSSAADELVVFLLDDHPRAVAVE